MTKPLSPESPRRAYARRFAAELQLAMRTRRISARNLAAVSGTSRSGIQNYRGAANLPTLEIAQRLADHLDWESLLTLVRESRNGRCAHCLRPFVHNGQGPKRFCSNDCRKAAGKGRSYEDSRVAADRNRRALQLHMAAVAAFCDSCEASGICRTPECELRPVSPLPLHLPRSASNGRNGGDAHAAR